MTQKTHGPARGQAAALSKSSQTTATMTAQTNPDSCLIAHGDGSVTLSDRRAYACLSATWEISQLCHLMASLPTGTAAEGDLVARGLTARILQLNSAIMDGLDDAQEGIEDIERAVFLKMRSELKGKQ